VPPSRDVPQATFTGEGAGCANLVAYRASADHTQYAGVQLDREQVGIAIGSARTIDLGETPLGVEVFVDVYESAVASDTPYCTDHRSEDAATATRWTAQAGKVTIELAADPRSTRESPTYRATLRLETVHFVGPEGGFAVIVPSVVIEDVLVGWSPG
jgi:hypothetical protein